MSLMDDALDGARFVGSKFTRYDDDWSPVMMVASESDGVRLVNLAEAQSKEEMLVAIVDVIAELQSQEAAVIISSWKASVTRDDFLSNSVITPSSQRKDREEVLMIYGGTPGHLTAWSVPILRDGKTPPRLGETVEETDSSRIQSTALEAISRGFLGAAANAN